MYTTTGTYYSFQLTVCCPDLFLANQGKTARDLGSPHIANHMLEHIRKTI
jgi:hypothetical protein